MSKGFVNLILHHVVTSLLVYKLKPHKVRSTSGNRKRSTSKTIIAQATSRDAASEHHQVRSESLETFQPSLYASSKGKWVSSFLKTTPSEIGFPMTLTSGAFLNQKRNKQTSHEHFVYQVQKDS